MTDAQAQAVKEGIEEFLASPEGQWLDIRNPQHLDQLLAAVRPGVDEVDEGDLRVVTLMCRLGRENAGIPPQNQRDALLAILMGTFVDPPEQCRRALEFAVAYGCGKWREVQEGLGGWDHQWEGAVRALAWALDPAVQESDSLLRQWVVGYPPRSALVLESDASYLAVRLKHPEHALHLGSEDMLSIQCTPDGTVMGVLSLDYRKTIPPGAKAVWTVSVGPAQLNRPGGAMILLPPNSKCIILARDEEARFVLTLGDNIRRVRLKEGQEANVLGPATLAIRGCSCGNVHCEERHRLEEWDPAQVSLWAFLASAVKGPQPNIQTGSFVAGLYFPLLAQEGLTL